MGNCKSNTTIHPIPAKIDDEEYDIRLCINEFYIKQTMKKNSKVHIHTNEIINTIKRNELEKFKILFPDKQKYIDMYTGYTITTIACLYGDLKIGKYALENVDDKKILLRNDKCFMNTIDHLLYNDKYELIKVVLDNIYIDINKLKYDRFPPLSKNMLHVICNSTITYDNIFNLLWQQKQKNILKYYSCDNVTEKIKLIKKRTEAIKEYIDSHKENQKNDKECHICYESCDITIVYVPCGHIINVHDRCLSEEYARRDTCMICRDKYENIIRGYKVNI